MFATAGILFLLPLGVESATFENPTRSLEAVSDDITDSDFDF